MKAVEQLFDICLGNIGSSDHTSADCVHSAHRHRAYLHTFAIDCVRETATGKPGSRNMNDRGSILIQAINKDSRELFNTILRPARRILCTAATDQKQGSHGKGLSKFFPESRIRETDHSIQYIHYESPNDDMRYEQPSDN
jgi:hypothetical protein